MSLSCSNGSWKHSVRSACKEEIMWCMESQWWKILCAVSRTSWSFMYLDFTQGRSVPAPETRTIWQPCASIHWNTQNRGQLCTEVPYVQVLGQPAKVTFVMAAFAFPDSLGSTPCCLPLQWPHGLIPPVQCFCRTCRSLLVRQLLAHSMWWHSGLTSYRWCNGRLVRQSISLGQNP